MSLINYPADLKFCERITSPLLFQPDWHSILRIALWFLFFIVLAHIITPRVKPQLPFTKEMMKQSLTPLATTPSDPRYVRLDKQNMSGKIIWVGGSSLAITNKDNTYRFLPDKGAVSIKMASRLLDSYTMTLDAISRQPEKLVVVINPFWVMNDKSLFFKTNMMNAGTKLWANKTDWPLIPLLTSPGNILWGVAAQHHTLVANGYDYLKLAQPSKPKAVKKDKSAKPKKLSYNQPLLFWISQRYEPDTNFTSFDAKDWQVKAMMQNKITESIWGQKILRQMFEKIKESGIPTLIYIAPTSPDLERTEARVAYQTVMGQIDAIAGEFSTPNIRYIGRVPATVTRTLTFTDHLHLSDSGTLPSYLTNEIKQLRAAQ